MEKSILDEFLDENLLAALRDDSDFKLIQAAANDLGAALLEKTEAIPHFVVAALDGHISANDPVYGTVQTIAKSKWNTILNVIGPEPVQVYRGIILGALEVVVSERADLISAVVLSAANVPEAAYGTQEAGPICKFLDRLKVEQAARVENVWVSAQSITFPKVTSKPRNSNIKADILAGLSKAAGPTNLKGETVEGFNPNYATANLEWTKFFVENAGETLFKAIQAGFDQNSSEVREAVATLTAEFERLSTRDAKSELLWLKESGYSLSGKKSLREMSEIEVLFYSVFDVSGIVGTASAPSIEWFLHDIVEARCPGDMEVKTAIEGFAPFLGNVPDEVKIGDPAEPVGRRMLIEIAIAPSNATSFETQSGLPVGCRETFANLARRLFRELQSLKIVTRE